MKDPDIFTWPFAGASSDTWPTSQLLGTSEETLLFSPAAAVQIVDRSVWPWTLGGALTLYDLTSPGDVLAATAGGLWQLADFGGAWMAGNGACQIVQDGRFTSYGLSEKYLVAETPVVDAIANVRGRLLCGGFDPTDSWAADWESFFSTWMAKSPEASVDYASMELGENFVAWSQVGRNLWALWDPATDPIEHFEGNGLGFIYLPWRGSVYSIKEMATRPVIYGENGIAVMQPFTEPTVGFGATLIHTVGVAGRCCVAGTDRQHVFLSAQGDLMTMSVNYQVEKLGYREYLEPLLGQDIILTYNADDDEYYIGGEESDGTRHSFVLTPHGFSEILSRATSIINADGAVYAYYADSTDTDLLPGLITLQETDFRSRDFKTVTMLQIEGEFPSSTYGAVYWRNDSDSAWTLSTWKLFNSAGYARIQVTAIEFRVAIKTSAASEVEVDDIIVHRQLCGRRTSRGLSVNQADQ